MPDLQQFPLVTSEGVRGTILRRARFLSRDETNLVRLEDGREFEVNSSEVQVRADGTFVLESSPAPPNGGPQTEPKPKHEAFYTEEANIERVPVNRVVDSAPQTRQEGDVTIIPVVEEVLVVEKRLLLKEEIHIRRTRNQVREPRRIMAESGVERG